MLGLILEGGSMRARFVAVALMAFIYHNCVDIDAGVTISTNVPTLVCFAAGRRKEMERVLRDELNTPKFVYYLNIPAASLALSPKRPIIDWLWCQPEPELLETRTDPL